MTATFIRLLDVDDKRQGLVEARSPARHHTFDVSADAFSVVPGSPFLYWVGEAVRGTFSCYPKFDSDGRVAKLGIKTDDDSRFIRAWWESPAGTSTWVPILRGGMIRPFFTNVDMTVLWHEEGKEIKALSLQRWGSIGKRIYNERFFLNPGITWAVRPHQRGAFAHVPPGCIFSNTGGLIVPAAAEHWALCAVLNSSTYLGLLQLLMPRGGEGSGQTLKYEVGYVTAVPIPNLEGDVGLRLSAHAREAWSERRALAASDELSHYFELPWLLWRAGSSLRRRDQECRNHLREAEERLSIVRADVDRDCQRLYAIEAVDERALFVNKGEDSRWTREDDDEDVGREVMSPADSGLLASELLSWCVGVGFGRFDVRLATGEREPPPEPDPFDPLPMCSPGMLTGEDGLPVDAPPEGYSIAWPQDGILVDDPGHPRDLTAAVREVFDVVFGAEADAFWTEAVELVDPKSHDIRRWLQKIFFSEHIKRYSKSRRKAPIYWQLATASASYSVWLYAHRIGRDSLYQVLNDLVSPKLQAEERKLNALMQEAGPNPSAAQRKELAALEAFVEELRMFRDELARVAPLWNPDLNDGVVIVTAPLWRLVPQNKAWQKELKSHWDALSAGKYDWTQLAMHLWPERVVPKCAEDRSLAIADDLEDVFWEQDAAGKWGAREVDQSVVERLIAERSSPAVKDALGNLMTEQTSGTRRPLVQRA